MTAVRGDDWRKKFVGITAHLRSRGHTRAFVMLGDDLRAPGMIDSARLLDLCTKKADNDNQEKPWP